jgi:hypothetical protein
MNSSGASASASAKQALSPLTSTPTMNWVGIGLQVLGVLVVTISLILQFFIIDNGSSGQLTVDNEMKKSLVPILTGATLFIVGYLLWVYFNTFRNKYLPMFALAFSSYFIANFALMSSLYQVQLSR